MPRQPTLIIFAKPPLMGLSKTRLARSLSSPVEARRIARTLLLRTLRAARDPRWRTLVALTPDRHVRSRTMRRECHPFTTFSQPSGDLGHRLFVTLLRRPAGPVAVIGSDAPDISRALIWQGFCALRGHDGVVGPALDGGFWLLGLHPPAIRRKSGNPFHPVRWSSALTLQDVERNLGPSVRLARLRELADLDTAEDLANWRNSPHPRGVNL